MPKRETRLPVRKTYKLFLGGKFVRGENGRVVTAKDAQGKTVANYARASRKDFRDAVVAARGAVAGWSKNSAYLRGQILNGRRRCWNNGAKSWRANWRRWESLSAPRAGRSQPASSGWSITRAGRTSLHRSLGR